MAKKKAKRAPAKRRTAPKKATRRTGGRRGSVVQAGMKGALMDIVMGVAGAVLVAKVAPKIPIESNKMKYGALTVAGALLALKVRSFRGLGIGAGIASASLLANEFFPTLLGPGGPVPVGRLSPDTQRRMQAAAERIRMGISGSRGRTIMGNGSGDDFPQPVNGPRGRTIMGSGENSSFSY